MCRPAARRDGALPLDDDRSRPSNRRQQAEGTDAMPKTLTEDQVAAYRRDGYLCPLRAMSPREMTELRVRYDSLCARDGGTMSKRTNQKPHLLVTWLDELVRHPRILDAVEDVIGPDILVYHSTLFLKEARTPAYVRWHQDSTYFYLQPHLHVTARRLPCFAPCRMPVSRTKAGRGGWHE